MLREAQALIEKCLVHSKGKNKEELKFGASSCGEHISCEKKKGCICLMVSQLWDVRRKKVNDIGVLKMRSDGIRDVFKSLWPNDILIEWFYCFPEPKFNRQVIGGSNLCQSILVMIYLWRNLWFNMNLLEYISESRWICMIQNNLI